MLTALFSLVLRMLLSDTSYLVSLGVRRGCGFDTELCGCNDELARGMASVVNAPA